MREGERCVCEREGGREREREREEEVGWGLMCVLEPLRGVRRAVTEELRGGREGSWEFALLCSALLCSLH